VRTAALNEDSVVEDGQPVALPVGVEASRNMVLATGSAVQVVASGSNAIAWPQQATPQSNTVVVPAGSSLTFFFTLGVWWVIAEGGVPLAGLEQYFTQSGQLIVGTGGGTGELLNAGPANTVLTVGGSDPSGLEWAVPTPATTIAPGWTQLSPATVPSVRAQGVSAGNQVDNNAIMFGGWNGSSYYQDTYQWLASTSTWSLLSPSTKPAARRGLMFASVGNTYLLFGGINASGTYLQDSYSWTGSNWTSLSPAAKPSIRAFSAMAYSTFGYSGTSGFLLFGGYNGTSRLGDTYIYQSANWVSISPATSPSARQGAVMVENDTGGTYDVILFGGYDGTNYLNDTWVWNGTTWISITPASTSPPARANATMMFNSPYITLFGGNNASGPLNDTWIWTGADWVEVASSTNPPARENQMLAYSHTGSTLTLFGGYNGTSYLNDTWQFKLLTGPPTTGTWVQNQEYVDNLGQQWVCTVGGTPGQWVATPSLITSQLAMTLGQWATYTPVWTCTTSAPSIGSGALSGRYTLIGKMCTFTIDLETYSDTSGGNGYMYFTLPFTAAYTENEWEFGTKLYIGQAVWQMIGFGYSPGGTNYIVPNFPVSSTNLLLSQLANEVSGGGPTTSIPYVNGTIFPISYPGNLHIWGTYEIA
jgi:hypothetical protein